MLEALKMRKMPFLHRLYRLTDLASSCWGTFSSWSYILWLFIIRFLLFSDNITPSLLRPPPSSPPPLFSFFLLLFFLFLFSLFFLLLLSLLLLFSLLGLRRNKNGYYFRFYLLLIGGSSVPRVISLLKIFVLLWSRTGSRRWISLLDSGSFVTLTGDNCYNLLWSQCLGIFKNQSRNGWNC